MSEPWIAEREVSPSLAETLVDEAFADLDVESVSPFGSGWDNSAYLVTTASGERLVFRFPRREFALQFFESETRVLPQLAPRLSLPIPVPRWRGEGTEAFPWPFAGYELLEGRTACVAAVPEQARFAAAGTLGRFLGELHAIDAETGAAVGAPNDTIRRLDVPFRSAQLDERFERARELGLIDDRSDFDPIFEDVPAGFTATPRALVHGDLYARHLLVDDAHRLCGVIDWGDVHVGEPASDLGLVHGFLPRAAHDAFRAAYEAHRELDDVSWRVGRFAALNHAVRVVIFAHEISDAPLRAEAQLALTRLRERV